MKNLPNTTSIERLRELFVYDPQSGVLKRVKSRGTRKAGSVAGFLQNHGHLSVIIDGASFGVHRVAWAMHYGEWPDSDIDHINGLPADNRISNLRTATVSQNIGNARAYKRRLPLPRGVNLATNKDLNGKRGGKRFIARIRINTKLIHLGSFATAELANAAYEKARAARMVLE